MSSSLKTNVALVYKTYSQGLFILFIQLIKL
uniref:Uncharacterized protein n=1 Tax=Anguilla anguilla TaxID=7936 RepID=A0A0E9R3J2_ANGAN